MEKTWNWTVSQVRFPHMKMRQLDPQGRMLPWGSPPLWRIPPTGSCLPSLRNPSPAAWGSGRPITTGWRKPSLKTPSTSKRSRLQKKKRIVENFKSFVFIIDYPINFQRIFIKLYSLILLKFYYFQESEKSRTRDKNGAVFLTETKAETPGKSPF